MPASSPARLRALVLTLAVLFAALLSAPHPIHAQTPVTGNVSGVWTAAGSPYQVVGNVNIAAGQTLTIDKNVTVLFDSNEFMTVSGTLIVQGQPNEGVVFTSNGGVPGSWSAVYPQSLSVVDINHAIFEFGGQGGGATIYTTSGSATSVTIHNTTVRDSAGDGIRISAAAVDLNSVTASNNALDGIEVTTSGAPPVLDNLLMTGNGGRGLVLNNNPGNLPGNLVGSGNGMNGAWVTGILGGTTAAGRWTWQNSQGFPVICQNVTVSADSLDIEAGATIKMAASNASLTFSTDSVMRTGVVLDAQSVGPVWITSLADDSVAGDTNADGPSVGTPGDWNAVFAQSSSTFELLNTWMAYGGFGGAANLLTTSGAATSIDWNGGGSLSSADDGIRCNAALVSLRSLTLDDNGVDGAQVTTSGTPPVLDSIAANGNGARALVLTNNPGDLPGTLTGSGNGTNGITVSGNLGGTAAARLWLWEKNPGFPVICQTVSVTTDSLDVEAGATIKMLSNNSWLGINTNARLRTGVSVDAQSGGPVWITSIADDSVDGDTNGDGPSSGTPGDWNAVFAQSSSTLELVNTWMAFGGFSGAANLATTSGSATSIDWNGGGSLSSANDGIRCNAALVSLRALSLDDNAVDGMEVTTSGTPPVLDGLSANNNGARAMALVNNPGNIPGNMNGSGNGTNGIEVTANLGGSSPAGRWLWENSPNFPIICRNVSVTADTLDVEAGTVIKMLNTSSWMGVNSGAMWRSGVTVDAQSTGPVWITSLHDDAIGGDTDAGSPTAPAPGDWTAVYSQSGSTLELIDTWFSYGGASASANLLTTSGVATSLVWSGGGSTNSANDGVRVNTGSADLSNLNFDGNAVDGLELTTSGLPPTIDALSANNNGARALVLTNNPGSIPGNLSGSGNGTNGIYVSGNLGGTAPAGLWRWEDNDNFPVVCGNVSVTADTLEIHPRSVVKFWSTGSWIGINSGALLRTGVDTRLLRAAGTFGPVWFTALADDAHGGDTNGDGAATAPAPGSWSGIYLQSASVSELTETWFAYGGASSQANVLTTSGAASSLVWNGGGSLSSANDGMRVNTNTASVTDVRFASNLDDGVQLSATGGATFGACDFVGNTTLGLRWAGGLSIAANGNWWGDASGPFHPTSNPSGLGQQVSNNVDYSGWSATALTNALPGEFALLSPADADTLDLLTAAPDSVFFSWEPAIDPDADPVTYELQVNITPSFAPAGEVFKLTGLTATSVWLQGFAPGATFYWCVTASDGTEVRSSTPSSRVFHTKGSGATSNEPLPLAFAVGAAAPNPFTSRTVISFSLPSPQPTTVVVYDLRGRRVQTLLNGVQPAGRHLVEWNGRDDRGQTVASGVYFARVVAVSGTSGQRLVLVR